VVVASRVVTRLTVDFMRVTSTACGYTRANPRRS